MKCGAMLVMLAIAAAVPVSLGAAGCKPAQEAEISTVERIVLSGIVNGETAEQIEKDVASALAGKPGVDVVILVNDAIAILRDLGVIPAGSLQHTDAVSMRVHEQLAAAGRKR